MEAPKLETEMPSPVESSPLEGKDFGMSGRLKRYWGFALAIVLLAIAGVVAWRVWDAAEDERVDAVAVTLKDDLTVPFGKEVRVSDFLEDLQGSLVDDVEIDTERLGEVEVEFEYINVRNKRRKRSLVVEVIDAVAPKIYGSSLYTVNRGYNGDLTNLMMSGDDVDDTPRREVAGKYDLDKVGDYVLEYVITDASGNAAKQPFTLRVVEPQPSSGGASNSLPKLEFAEAKRLYGGEGKKMGIDVSQWQGEIDWRKVKDVGVEFAMIRVGYQKGYGGEYVEDPYFVENMRSATEVGLPVGAYFYSYADSEEEARAQAEWVATKLDGFEVGLPVAFDWEDWGNFNIAGMSFWKINRVAKAFLDTIAERGAKAIIPYSGMLYGSKVYLERIWEDLGYPVWLAQYYDRVTYTGEYMMWQLSCTGRVDGIAGDVDLDVWYVD